MNQTRSIPITQDAPSRRAPWLPLSALVLLSFFTSGLFLLKPFDLALPRCSEPTDAAIYPWNFFWFRESLTSGSDLLFTRHLFHPTGEGLSLYTPTLVYAAFAATLHAILPGPHTDHLCVALLLFLSSVATAVLAFQLWRQWGLTRTGSLVAAALFLVCSGRLINIARLNLFCTELLLLVLILSSSVWRHGGLWRGLSWGAALAVLLWQSQPLLYQALLAHGVFVLGTMLYADTRVVLWRRKGAILAGLLVFATLAAPFIARMSEDLGRSPAAAQSIVWSRALSLDLSALFLPHSGDFLYGRWLGARPASFLEGGGLYQSHFLGFVWIAWVVIAIASNRPRDWLLKAAFVLTMIAVAAGPQLQWRGRPLPVPGPLYLVREVPFLPLDKSPERLILMAQLGLALLAGMGVDSLIGRRSWKASLAIPSMLLLSLVEQSETLPQRSLQSYRVPERLDRVAVEPGEFAVLDVPLDRPGHPSHRVTSTAMAFAAHHHRPIFFATFPRASRRNFETLRELCLLEDIDRISEAVKIDPPPLVLPRDVAWILRELRDLKVRYVLVHHFADAPEDVLRESELLDRYFGALGPGETEELIVGAGYRVRLLRF